MKKLNVYLGVGFRSDVFSVITVGLPRQVGEIHPELIFRACNRIDDTETDIDGLKRMVGYGPDGTVLAALRRNLDRAMAPSMSSGDVFTITNRDGRVIVASRVEPTGWSHGGRELVPDLGAMSEGSY